MVMNTKVKIMVVTSSPNKEGLTAACGEAARRGIEASGGEAVLVCLNHLNVARCSACGNGWGTCNKEHTCQVADDFQKLHEQFGRMDAYVIVTPVYWSDMSESAKAFFDRLRRCEATNRAENNVQGKPVVAVAAAGGGGNGTLQCLESIERMMAHMRMEKYDLIGITRKNREYKLETIEAAASGMTAYCFQKAAIS